MSLLRCKTRNFFFSFGVVNVYFIVGYIQITSANDRLSSLFETFQIFEEVNVPLFSSICKSFETFSSIWSVNSYKIKLLKLYCHNSSFAIVTLMPHFILNTYRLHFSQHRSTRVSLFYLTAIPILLIFLRKLFP